MNQSFDERLLQQMSNHYPSTFEEIIPITEGFQNKVFKVRGADENYILRLTESDRKSFHQLKGEVSFVHFLKQNGASVSGIIPTLTEEKIVNVQIHQDRFYMVLFEKADGNPVQVTNPVEWNSRLFEEWGRVIGQIHALGKRFSTPVGCSLSKWSEDNPFNHDIFQDLNGMEAEKYEYLVQQIKKFPKDTMHFGLIHNDFHQGNFFVKNGRITVFDFDDCMSFFYAYDIATAFYHAYWQQTSFNGSTPEFTTFFFTIFLQGYQKENQLTEEIIDQIPVFLKLRELFLYVLFQSVWQKEYLADWQAHTLSNLRKNIEGDTPFGQILESEWSRIKKVITINKN